MDRLETLHGYGGWGGRASASPVDGLPLDGMLASSTQDAIDRVTCLARTALDVSAVCTSVIDAGHGLLTSCYGVPVPTALLLSHAFRKHVLLSGRPLVVDDGQSDPLLAHHPAMRDGTVRACIAMPLSTGDSRPLGTLVVVDKQPRRWAARELELLRSVAALIVCEMEFSAAMPRVGARIDPEETVGEKDE